MIDFLKDIVASIQERLFTPPAPPDHSVWIERIEGLKKISVEEYFQTYKPQYYDPVFVTEVPIVGNPFKKKNWECVILNSELFVGSVWVQGLDAMLQECGEQNFFITDDIIVSLADYDEYKPTILSAPWNWDSFELMESHVAYADIRTAFGMSQKWGFVSWANGHSYLGAEPELMEIFYRIVPGGKKQLLEDFLEHSDTPHHVEGEDDYVVYAWNVSEETRQKGVKQAQQMLVELGEKSFTRVQG